MEEKFDLFGLSEEVSNEKPTINREVSNDISLVCEAIQIVKMVKSVMTTRREIVDTIKIDGAKMTYERAMRVAKSKAQMIGNCMVIEKMERVAFIF